MTIRQSNKLASGLPAITLMGILASLVVAPQIALAGYALMVPALRASIAEQPMAALQFAVALVFWTLVVCVPLRLMALRLARRRTIQLTRHQITVRDEHPFASAEWAAAVAEYDGLTHHVRSSLSGVRQEIVLVHPVRKLSVVLIAAEHITADNVERFAKSLTLPILAAEELYRLGRRPNATHAEMELSPVLA